MTLSTKLFLRITLTLIGAAALTGVLAALGAAGSYGGQVGGTCAVAFGVVFSAWCARNKFSQPHTRPAELVFAGGLAITLLLAVVAIWLPESSSQKSIALKIGLSSVCFYLAALAGSSVFAAWSIPVLRFASRAGTAVVGLLLCLALVGIWGTSDRCLQAMFLVASFGLAISVSLIGLGHERRPWRWVGFGAAWIMMIWGLAKIGSAKGFLDNANPWYITGWCVVGGATYALLVVRVPLRAAQEWLRKLTFVLVGLVLAIISAWAFYGHESEPLARILGACVILATCGTLVVLVLSRFAQPVEADNPLAPTLRYTQDDFDLLSWHDCPLHGIRFEAGPEAWEYRVIFDIDFLAQWVPPQPPEQGYRFKIAPADWVFEGVSKLHMDIAPQAFAGHLIIDRVTRLQVAERPEWATWQWTIELHAPSNQEGKPGRIQFCAPEMRLLLRKEPRLHDRQELAREER